MPNRKILIFIPTYNERENIEPMCAQLLALGLDADLLFVDDNSPDGTGGFLDELAQKYSNLFVMHRPGKLGVGSAHLDGIRWAYDHGYDILITLDCDFTHSPADIEKLLQYSEQYDVAVGSRFLKSGSLPGWNLYRRFMTHLGYFLTRHLLKVKQDATGGFRVYGLRRIPRGLFMRVKSKGYSFFFESLFLLTRNAFSIVDVPIVLPARTYGHSKMTRGDTWQSALRLLSLYWESVLHPDRFNVEKPAAETNPLLVDLQGWDSYWNQEKSASNKLYEWVAAFYRNLVIRHRLNHALRKHFPAGARLLHAGCGSGQVDKDIQYEFRLSAIDISGAALRLYHRNVIRMDQLKHASVLDLPFESASFDGVYNLGVMEHFPERDIRKVLVEFDRVLRPDGKIVLFWPHICAASVLFLNAVHWLMNRVLKQNIRLHPPEISLLRSKNQIESLLAEARFELIDYYFGARDLFVQAIVVGQKSKT